MENHDNQPTAFEQELSVPEPTEIERIQNRVKDFKVGLTPASAEAVVASMQILLTKGLIKLEELDAIISIREEVNKGLIDYQTTVTNAQKDMEIAQQNLLIQQEQERQQVLAEKDTQIEDERLLRKRTEDNLQHQMNRAAQMEAVLKSHGINIDLDGDGIVGLKEGQTRDTLSASEQAEVNRLMQESREAVGWDANGSPVEEKPKGDVSGAFKLARMMNPVDEIDEGSNGIKEEDFPKVVTHDEELQKKIDETKKSFKEWEEENYIPVPEKEEDIPPQVAGGLISGTDTESFLEEVDRVAEVEEIDNMTEEEEQEKFEEEWEEPTLDIGYDKSEPSIEEMEGVEKVESSAPVITSSNAPSVTKEHLADGVFIERENIKSFAEEEDLQQEEEFEEVVIPNRQDLEKMTKKEILQSASNLSFEVDSKLTKPRMIDTFETQANALIEELTGEDDFVSATEEQIDGDDDRRDGGYF